MKEIKRILTAYEQIDLRKRKVALATEVYVQGSAYRRPGARILVSDDGRCEDAISDGCLEGDALRKARRVMLDGKPVIVRYDTIDPTDPTNPIALLQAPFNEIALSILSEINAFFSQHSGGFLSNRPGPIHERSSDRPERVLV
ncbi:XdhC family protein [Spirosoma sp. SC4-14]|uniref:XdhC family protein n=1 Tax=Spirosoma sp. SC4-14 TaxID=3128900 RepID=UPI0030D4DAC8